MVIHEDSIVEGAEQFTAQLELQEGTVGILLGERNEAVVTIEDNDCECMQCRAVHLGVLLPVVLFQNGTFERC